MFNATLTAPRAVRILAIAHAALTTNEAKALYSEVGGVIAHSFMLVLSWAVWLVDALLTWSVYEAPALVCQARSILREAVAASQPEPLALPWSAQELSLWSNELEIVWPEASPNAPQWVTGMMAG